MKKVLFVIVALFAFSMQGVAQKGMQGFGANLAGNVCEGLAYGGGLKYQYNLSDYIRLEPSFSYYAAEDDSFNMLGFVNMHLFFSSPKAFRPYFFAGPGYMSYYETYYEKGYEESYTEDDFGFDGGFGLDYRVSHNLSLQVEAGAVIGVGDDDHFGAKFNIGCCYNF